MTFLAEPNPALPGTGRKRPNNGAAFTQPSKNAYRTDCKVCRLGVYVGDATVWGRGQYLGLLHAPCAERAGADAMPAAADGRHVPPLPEAVARPTATPSGDVTERQVEMLQLKADGLTDEQIGAELGVTARTVGNILRAARDRLGAASTLDAVSVARRLGLLRAEAS